MSSRGAAADLSGARIGTVIVMPEPPRASGRLTRLVAHLHATTRASTVWRDLRFAPGDTVDTLVVGETMRRLRQRPYLASAVLQATRCTPGDVALRVTTVDRWSLSPTAAVQSGSSYAGIEERDLFGTGRGSSLLVASRHGKLGGAIGYTDPFLFNLPVSVRVRAARYADGEELRGRFRNAERSVLDPSLTQLTVSHYRQDSRRVERFANVDLLVDQAFRRDGAFFLYGHRLGVPTTSVLSLLLGADYEHASLSAPDRAFTIGPKLVERQYYGPSAGLARRAVTYDTVAWLADRQVLVDVPLGLEFEGLLGIGREAVGRRAGSFGSAWIGRTWMPNPEALMAADFWTSGYLFAGRGNVDAASSRALLSWYRHVRANTWIVHAAAEKLVNPDPDIRALATYDPTIALIPQPYRLSENALAGEVGRRSPLATSLHGLGWATFVAGSFRHASALSQHDHFGMLALGTGLRLLPSGPTSGTLRVDLLYPVLSSAGVRRSARLAVSVAPWFEANRQREDPRLRQ